MFYTVHTDRISSRSLWQCMRIKQMGFLMKSHSLSGSDIMCYLYAPYPRPSSSSLASSDRMLHVAPRFQFMFGARSIRCCCFLSLMSIYGCNARNLTLPHIWFYEMQLHAVWRHPHICLVKNLNICYTWVSVCILWEDFVWNQRWMLFEENRNDIRYGLRLKDTSLMIHLLWFENKY